MENRVQTASDEIEQAAAEALAGLLPAKSKERYETEYDILESWLREKNVMDINETVLLAYFNEKSKKYQPSSIWSKYSMIKKTLLVKKNIDISKYYKLTSFLKINGIGHEPKKARVLSEENVLKFLKEAPDEMYLMIKVALVFGIYGACRREELANISTSDVDDRGSVIVVTIPKTKTNRKRVFTIVDDNSVCGLELFKKYVALRARNVAHSRLFLQYRKNACTIQPVGKNTFGSIPKTIETFLQLPNPEQYTGHTFRRTSATLLADSGADITSVKIHGGWRSSSVAEGYLEDSIEQKNKIARLILGSSSIEEDASSGKTDIPPSPTMLQENPETDSCSVHSNSNKMQKNKIARLVFGSNGIEERDSSGTSFKTIVPPSPVILQEHQGNSETVSSSVQSNSNAISVGNMTFNNLSNCTFYIQQKQTYH